MVRHRVYREYLRNEDVYGVKHREEKTRSRIQKTKRLGHKPGKLDVKSQRRSK